MISRRATIVLAVLVTGFCAAAPLRAAPAEGEVRQLIDALAHPDPLEREKAEKGLIALGAAAREAVVEATQSDDPEIASRARGVLLRLPWALPTDSPNARQLLARYGPSVQERAAVIVQLAAKHEIGVLLRLLEQEPEAELRWHVVGQLEDLDDLELDRRLKALPVTSANAPTLFLAAKRCERVDRARAMELFRRVIDLESVAAVPSLSGVFQAYDRLIGEAVRKADYDGATELLREQAARAGGTSAARIPVARLLALHAYVGPLRGWSRDLRAMGETVARPLFTDNVAGLYEFLGLAPPPLLAVWGQANAKAPAEMRYWAGEFLARHQLLAAAEIELRAVVAGVSSSPPDTERGAPAFYDYDYLASEAHKLLAHLAGVREDDLAAAEHLRRRAELLADKNVRRGNGRVLAMANDENNFAEMHWRYLRAARSAGDQKKLREHLDVLKVLTPANTDIVLDVVPLLKESGQPEAARTMFDKTYKELRARVDAEPNDPEPMNNLAWLCARSGERLPEALDLATRAITLEPDNAAYLDTAAEANFRVGNIDEAIRLETKGLEGRPNDKFMKEQLERFRAAKMR